MSAYIRNKRDHPPGGNQPNESDFFKSKQLSSLHCLWCPLCAAQIQWEKDVTALHSA